VDLLYSGLTPIAIKRRLKLHLIENVLQCISLKGL
jgi:hypothetical protein